MAELTCEGVDIRAANDVQPIYVRFVFYAGVKPFDLIANGPKRVKDVRKIFEHLSRTWPQVDFQFEAADGRVSKVL